MDARLEKYEYLPLGVSLYLSQLVPQFRLTNAGVFYLYL